jgi:hypothetical protein
MRTITEQEFLRWAAGKNLGLDPQYPDSAVLDFRGTSESRFWAVPPEPERRPYLIASLLELMGDWQTCYAWRHLGSWPDPSSVDVGRVNDVVESRILQGLGLPLGTADVVIFDRRDLPTLTTLLFSTTVFGWSVGEDLYVVPDHGRYVLETDHHGVIHVAFHDPREVGHWVSEMAQRGFDLPEDVPDSTFKRPSWMPE